MTYSELGSAFASLGASLRLANIVTPKTVATAKERHALAIQV